jgi:hypothetical protein
MGHDALIAALEQQARGYGIDPEEYKQSYFSALSKRTRP